MNQSNPYSPPEARIESEQPPVGLAGRWERLGAALVDSFVLLALLMPLFWFGGYFDAVRIAAESGRSILPFMAISTIASFAGYLFVQGWPLYTAAQTWGKKILGIRVVDLEGRQASFSRLILKRQLPISVLGRIPFLGMVLIFVDALLIFRADHRCGHDLIAGTRVVKVKAKAG